MFPWIAENVNNFAAKGEDARAQPPLLPPSSDCPRIAGAVS